MVVLVLLQVPDIALIVTGIAATPLVLQAVHLQLVHVWTVVATRAPHTAEHTSATATKDTKSSDGGS